ncbi:MAG: AAA family ATPase [Elusimicrobia bacterium]|nr:AAA family ATPase [Elusimicrobiota bacterium]
MVKNLILTGNPGVGKTTLIREVVLSLKDRVGGFFTQELKEEGKRIGFLLRTFQGTEGILAQKGLVSSVKFNKYGIDLKVLEGIGLQALKDALQNRKIVVIDEIGSMEVLSEPFRQMVLECFMSPQPVLATIRLGAQPFTDSVKKMSQTKVLALTRKNYGPVKQEVKEWLNGASSKC